MLTLENDSERMALKYSTPETEVSLELKVCTLYDNAAQAARGYTVQKSTGQYLRA